jgi:adenylate cyclase
MAAQVFFEEWALNADTLRRTLRAILAADAVSYSRLMALDEDGTVAALDASRAVFQACIDAHMGRTIDMAGDSVLAVFDTAAGAVSAAIEIQHRLGALGEGVALDRRLRFRIGVHLGDVIEKADRTIYGDGVNIAARLQAVAEPGCVAVSSMVREAVRDRVAAVFVDLGEHAVKNIARPVHVFQVAAPHHGGTNRGTRKFVSTAHRLRWRIAATAGVLLALAGGAWIGAAESARVARTALAALFGNRLAAGMPERASIAVMPFANQSGESKRDYFSDGITEDVIDALGRFSGVMVMSRNAVQAYKGRPATSAEIGRELGVRYIAQGSVREADGKFRVVVELSDAQSGTQLWAERYEGAGAQVFEIQDRIAKNIVGALAVNLTRVEQERVFSKPTDSLEAYDLVLRARSLLDLSERGANREARELLARAQKISPEYADIFTVLCYAEFERAVYGWTEDASGALVRAEGNCKRTLASTDRRAHARAHALIAAIDLHRGMFDEALSHTQRAIELNASDSTALYRRGAALLYTGRVDEALAAMETARRFEPQPGAGAGLNLSIAYYVAGRYREALEHADALLARAPHHVALNAIRAATLARIGSTEEARRAADQVRRLSPRFEAEDFGTGFAAPRIVTQLQEGLRLAGL